METSRAEKVAERQRRRTERKRRGGICVTIEVSRELRDEWIEDGRLGQWDEENREVVGAILQDLIDNPLLLTRDARR